MKKYQHLIDEKVLSTTQILIGLLICLIHVVELLISGTVLILREKFRDENKLSV